MRNGTVQLYNLLLINLLSTSQRRKKVTSIKFDKNADSPSSNMIWSNYLTRRVNPLANSRYLRSLYHPNEFIQSSVENKQYYNS